MMRVNWLSVDIPVCSLLFADTNSEGTCNSEAEHPCFNSLATCSSLPDYTKKTVKAFFVDSTIDLELPTGDIYNGSFPIANISSVSLTPPRIALGEGLGARGVLKVTFSDHPSSDLQSYEDPYTKERSYDPYKQGTFWAKWMARHKFLRGQEVRWAVVDPQQMSFDDMPDNAQIFIIDRFEISPGSVTMIAKDPASIIDDQRAIAPALNRGVLSADITASATTAVLSPVGIGNAEYPASGIMSLGGNEIVSFTRSNDNLTIVRAQYNTEAQAHEADDRVQVCIEYIAQDVATIIHDFMTTYGRIPESYIDLPSWLQRSSEFIDRTYTGLIAEPTPVKDLITEVLEQASSFVWWDGLEFRFDVLRNIIPTISYDDDLVRAGSISIKEQPEKRVSQVWIYFGQINPLESLQDPKNYSSALVTAEGTVADLEAKYENVPAVKTIFSRWINRFNRSAAELLNDRILQRFATPPKMVTFELLSSQFAPTLAQAFNFDTFYNQGPTGENELLTCQALEIRRGADTTKVSAEQVEFTEIVTVDPTIKTLDIDGDVLNFNWYNQFRQVFPGDPEDGDTVILRINSGARIGSESTSLAGLIVGNFPDGNYTLQVQIQENASVLGRGGRGGGTNFANGVGTAENGETGGPAIKHESTKELLIQNDGFIGSGGGGGGGGIAWGEEFLPSVGFDALYIRAAGGGAGAGYIAPQAGGIAKADDVGGGVVLVDLEDGSPGSTTSGGRGGSARYEGSTLDLWARGSTGGNRGSGAFPSPTFGENFAAAQGGGPGASIDGISNTVYSGTGFIAGPQIN